MTGQIRETVGPVEGVDSIEHHLAVRTDKTGSLIATSAEFGAYFAGVSPEVTETLRDFGEQIGIAFQLSDDLLDIASDSDASGKTPGTDLREGIDTLPVLYALRGSDPGAARLRELVASPLVDDADHAEALLLLRKSDAMVQARSTMTGYAESARSLLDRCRTSRPAPRWRAVRSRDRTDWLSRPHRAGARTGARGCLGAGSFHGLVISRNTRAIATMTAMVAHQTLGPSDGFADVRSRTNSRSNG